MNLALARKKDGNAAFAQGQWAEAAAAYTSGLDALAAGEEDADSGPPPPAASAFSEVHASLLTNRALCALKEGRWQSCVDDCDAALAVDGYRPKALFRRACAEEALGQPAKAIRDLRLLVRIDPENGAAIKQLRLLRAQMLAKPTGLRAALDRIQNAAAAARAAQARAAAPPAAGGSGAGTALAPDPPIPPPRDPQHAVHELRKVCAVCHGDDPVRVRDMLRAGGVRVLWALFISTPAAFPPWTKARVIKALAALACCLSSSGGHGAHGVPDEAAARARTPNTGAQTVGGAADARRGAAAAAAKLALLREVASQMDAGGLAAVIEEHAAARTADGTVAGDTADIVCTALLLLATCFAPPEPPSVSRTTAKARPDPPAPLPTSVCVVLSSCVAALRSPNESVRAAALDAVTRTCISRARAVAFMNRADVPGRSTGFGGLEAVLAVTGTGSEVISGRLPLVFGTLMGAVGDDDAVQRYAMGMVQPLLASVGKHTSVQDNIRGAEILGALFVANRDVGLWLVNQGDILSRLRNFARTAPSRTQALIINIFSHMASQKAGRELLDSHIQSLLKVLLGSDAPDVRSAAAVVLAKVDAVNFNPCSAEGDLVLGAVYRLLQPESTESEQLRAVEAIASVCFDTDVKQGIASSSGLIDELADELGDGGGDAPRVLEHLVRLGKGGNAGTSISAPLAYGLATIFSAITMDEDVKKMAKLREMEVTEEQWEKFVEFTKSRTTRKGTKDSSEWVAARIRRFCATSGHEALVHIVSPKACYRGGGKRPSISGGSAAVRKDGTSSKDPPKPRQPSLLTVNGKAGSGARSGNVRELVALAFANIACERTVRGQIVASGAVRTLLALVARSTENTKNCQCYAAHAIAKILVTTNPHLLPDATLVDCVKPIILLCKTAKNELQEFEGLMALTNLASVDEGIKSRIVRHGGLPAVEYLQFEENHMIRRAATEVICNIAGAAGDSIVDEVARRVSHKERIRLWVALMDSSEFGEDPATASAATATMALLGHTPAVAAALAAVDGGLRTLADNAGDDASPALQHRAAAAIRAVLIAAESCENEANAIGGEGLIQALNKEKMVLGRVLRHLSEGKGPAREAATDALARLERVCK